MSDKVVLVTGITGQQGSAVARHLLTKGWQVRGLVRDAQKPQAQAFREQGVELAQGDLEDRASLDAALRGAYGVFSVQTWMAPGGVEAEVRQGKALADAAKAAGVQHFVYSSVGGANLNTGIPHFDSKWVIEQHVRDLGLPATILRPAAFMDNLNWIRPMILNGLFAMFKLNPQTKLQLIAADDIGGLAALAFEQPERFLGTALDISGDSLSMLEQAEVLSRVIGRPVRYAPELTQDMGNEGEVMTQWFERVGYQADIPALRAIYPALINFETWLRRTGWENAQPVAESGGTFGNWQQG